jgi:hypothetical protein
MFALPGPDAEMFEVGAERSVMSDAAEEFAALDSAVTPANRSVTPPLCQ